MPLCKQFIYLPLISDHLWAQELRTPRDAPVDSMGCEALIELPPVADAKTGRYQVLVALMLSSQTKDQTVAQAIRKLQVV